MRCLPFLLLFLRACRAIAVPMLLSIAVVTVAYGGSAVGLQWEEPVVVRRAPTVAAAAAPAPVTAPAPASAPATAPAAAQAGEPRTTCTPSPDVPVPDMVGAIFRCRLTAAGFDAASIRRVTAEAVAVAQCESEFDPHAVVFDGRYRDAPHPVTGSRYSATGIFQFIRDRADRWIAGGYANATDPVANIDAAARVYIHNVQRGYPGWSDWACAAANDGFRATSVLPGWPGGPPQLPAWAWQH